MPKNKVTLVVAIGVIEALILLGLSLFRSQSWEVWSGKGTKAIELIQSER